MAFWLDQMKQELSARDDIASMRIRDRVHLGIKTRLELEIPYKGVWPQAMALGALP